MNSLSHQSDCLLSALEAGVYGRLAVRFNWDDLLIYQKIPGNWKAILLHACISCSYCIDTWVMNTEAPKIYDSGKHGIGYDQIRCTRYSSFKRSVEAGSGSTQ